MNTYVRTYEHKYVHKYIHTHTYTHEGPRSKLLPETCAQVFMHVFICTLVVVAVVLLNTRLNWDWTQPVPRTTRAPHNPCPAQPVPRRAEQRRCQKEHPFLHTYVCVQVFHAEPTFANFFLILSRLLARSRARARSLSLSLSLSLLLDCTAAAIPALMLSCGFQSLCTKYNILLLYYFVYDTVLLHYFASLCLVAASRAYVQSGQGGAWYQCEKRGGGKGGGKRARARERTSDGERTCARERERYINTEGWRERERERKKETERDVTWVAEQRPLLADSTAFMSSSAWCES